MTDGYASLHAHAYVDNSLSPTERAEFEATMRRDPRLKARVDAWEAQNEAIRLAFGAPRPPRAAPPPSRPSNENGEEAKPRLPQPQLRARAPSPAPQPVAPPSPRPGWPAAALGALAFAAAMLAFPGGPPDPREALMQRADAALRAAPAFVNTRLDFASDDPRAVAGWLGERFGRLDPKRLAPPGWTLLGVRIVPGLASTAAFVLYEDALGGRAGLLIEPTDDLPDLPPIGGRDGDDTVLAGAGDGLAYAAIGPTRSGIGALIPIPPGE